MPRPRHQIKEFEQEFKAMERAGWTIEHGKHFKLKCPDDCKCMMTCSNTPSGGNPLRVFTALRKRITCWKED